MAYQAMVLYGVVCKDRYHSIYRYCYDKIIRKQTIAQHNVKPRTTKVTILSWFGVKSRLKTFAVSIDTAKGKDNSFLTLSLPFDLFFVYDFNIVAL